MTIEWHYDENPPEPEEGCERAYLAALYEKAEDDCFTIRAWYGGGGQWSDDFDPIIAEDNVYAWAEWPVAPPQAQATTGGVAVERSE